MADDLPGDLAAVADGAANHRIRRMNLPRVAPIAFGLVALLAGIATAQEITFAPREPRAPTRHVEADPDWRRFFEPGAPWQRAASKVSTIELQPGYIDDASEGELSATAAGLRRLGISVTVPLQAVAIDPAQACGHAEGYDTPEHAAQLVAKLKRLGITPKYVSLDNPLSSGHYNKCAFSVADTAERTATIVAIFVEAFPDLVIGDIENTGIALHPGWEEDYRAFKRDVEARVRRHFDSLVLDVNWRSPAWPRIAEEMAKLAKSLGMRFGMIYNGDGLDESEAAWIAHAERNFTLLESERGVIPDIAVFSSWNKYPTRALPETSPDTMTWLIDRYALPRTRFEARREGRDWRVRLVDQAGRPGAGQPVSIAHLGQDPAQPPAVRSVSGTVPSEARKALIALRVNTECLCAGANDLLLGDPSYAETGGGSVQAMLPVVALAGKPRSDGLHFAPVPLAGRSFVRLRVNPDQHFLYNSEKFAVTAGAHYEFGVPLGAIDTEGLFGFVRLLWLDEHDKALGGPRFWDDGDRITAGKATTDETGWFTVPGSTQTEELAFAGNAALRPALGRIEPAAR
jgi:hypothetical protein